MAEDFEFEDVRLLPGGLIHHRKSWTGCILYTILATSIVANLLQAFGLYLIPNSLFHSYESLSKFAQLKNNPIETKWEQHTVYTSRNKTERDHAWDAIDPDNGIIAISKEWATEKDLPVHSTALWDANKTYYIVNAYHALHCVKMMYRSFMQYRLSVPQDVPEMHVIHCLDQLRLDIMCHADDTPRVTFSDGRLDTAEGQTRQCRDWDALETWTRKYPGCYRTGNINSGIKQDPALKISFCPEGSRELEKIRSHFKKGKDWKPTEEKVWSWFDD